RLRLVRWDGTAPLHRTVAVLADLTPVDTEKRAGASLQGWQPVAPKQGDELLAERPCPIHPGDVALQTQQTAIRHLPRADLIHDGPRSAQLVDQVCGERTAGRVPGLGCGPELADTLRRVNRLERQDRLDLRQRDLQLAQRRDQACLLELADLVETVARVLIHPCRRQQTQLVIEPQRLRGQPRASGELSDAQLIHVLAPINMTLA